MPSAREHLDLASKQLERVQTAWPQPTDWSDLSLYAFYCLENAVMAGAVTLNLDVTRQHYAKQDAAALLHSEHGLPDVYALLGQLNNARKAAAYGDVSFPDLDPEDVAARVENYVEQVRVLVREQDG